MEHDSLPGTGASSFGFAFNDSNFSDRVLRIEVMASPPSSTMTLEGGCTRAGITIAEWARNRKRRRADAIRDSDGQGAIGIGSQQEANKVEKICDEPMANVEEASRSNLTISSPNGPSSWSMDLAPILRAKSLHISSAILAAESRFFYKLFSKGTKESEQRDVTLRVSVAEEPALLDMLQFIYTGRVEASSALALLDVLMAADKFEVASCVNHCSRLLSALPMTVECALLYLDLPSPMRLADATQLLTDAAKGFLVSHFKDIMRFQDEIMNLPLVVIEALLSSDDLQIVWEDSVYDFLLKWAKHQYPNSEERKEVLRSRLASLVRLPMMTTRKLKKVLVSPELDQEMASKLVTEALFYKSEVPHRQQQLAIEDTTCRKYCERAYKYRPVKVVEFDCPNQQCTVFLDLKKEECLALHPQGRVYSQAFYLGGQVFFLSAHCNMDQQHDFHCFGLFLGMQEKGSASFSVDYEFGARSKPSKDFAMKYKGNYKFTGGKAVGYRNLLNKPWLQFIAEDSDYFIDNVLYLRAELTIRAEPTLMNTNM